MIKRFLIPHHGNGYRPHVLREISVACLILVSFGLFGLSLYLTSYVKETGLATAVYPAFLIDLTNETRLALGEPTLTPNPVLARAAELKGIDMASKEYFSHDSPDGITPWHWFSTVEYEFIYAGENLAINFKDSEPLHEAWLNSPAHRANIVNDRFQEIGIAAVPGKYKGNDTLYVVQMFGTPAPAAVARAEEPLPVETAEIPALIPEPIAESVPEIESMPAPETPAIRIIQEEETAEDRFIAVENMDILGASAAPTDAPADYIRQTPWYTRFIISPASAVQYIYFLIIALTIVSLAFIIGIEIKRQHPRQIMYGCFVFAFVLSLMCLNQEFFFAAIL